MARVSVPPLVGEDMVVRRMLARASDVVFIKGVLEAHEGLAQVFAERGGDLTVAAPKERARELDEVLEDLARETGATLIAGNETGH